MASQAQWAWPESFRFYYPPATTSGERLFYPNPSMTDRQTERAITIVNPTFQRRYLATAHAALEMPLLRSMTVEAYLVREGNWHKSKYHCAAEGNVAKVVWTSDSGFVTSDGALRGHFRRDVIVGGDLDDDYVA